jgi:hypothetical protein
VSTVRIAGLFLINFSRISGVIVKVFQAALCSICRLIKGTNSFPHFQWKNALHFAVFYRELFEN